MLLIYDRRVEIRTFVKYLVWVFLFLLGLNFISVYSVYCCDTIIRRIDFNHESNFPTVYATFLLGFSSYLLKKISKMDTPHTAKLSVYWKSLSYVFLYLALDEMFRLHDRLNQGVYGNWLKLYIPLVLIGGLAYLRFTLKLPARFRNLIYLSGGIFVLGAVGFEIIGFYFKKAGFGTLDIEYRLLATVEECLELLGVILFISTLLKFMYHESKSIIRIFPKSN